MSGRRSSETQESPLEDNRSRKRKRSISPVPNKPDYANTVAEPSRSDASEITNIYGKTGGAYIPPARLRQMQAKITDKSSEAYQRIAWEALKKSIHGFINKVNVSNISDVVRQLLSENVVRGRGLLVRSLLTAQSTSPTFTHVFAALIAIVNSKFPQVGELVLKRLINEFRKAFRRNQKDRCLSTARFLAHLVNQKVVHELIILELLTLLLEQTTDDSVEVAVAVLKECGAMLTRLVPKGVHGVFEHLRRILNEGNCDKRISYMLEVMFQIRRDGWKDHPIVLPELDLIQEDDQITHTTSLLDQVDPEDNLNVFRFDPSYLENEEKYAQIKASFFESDNESEAGSSSGDDASDSSEGEGDDGERTQGAVTSASTAGEGQQTTVIDQTETNLVHLRRTIYLMLQSSLSADEAGHRLLQLKIRPGEEYEVASMVLDCCAQTRSYESRYGRLAQRLCRVLLTFGNQPTPGAPKPAAEELGPGSRYKSATGLKGNSSTKNEETPVVEDIPPGSYVAEFERIFAEQYTIIHRLETAKLRNVALFFAHLLYTDSISWGVLQCVRLNERDTTSSGRIFLKHLFLELCSFMGLAKLQSRLRDETLQPFFVGLLPRENPKDTRFAINFLTTIGLGGLTLDLREHLQNSREAALAKREAEAKSDLPSADTVSSSSSSSSSFSSESDSASDTESKIERKKKKKKGRHSRSIKPKKIDKRKNQADNTTVQKGSQPKDMTKKKDAVSRAQSHLKERPLDTPFFNDSRNSPPRIPGSRDNLSVISKSADYHNKEAGARNRSPSLSPPRRSIHSTVTLVSAERNRSPFDTDAMDKENRSRLTSGKVHTREQYTSSKMARHSTSDSEDKRIDPLGGRPQSRERSLSPGRSKIRREKRHSRRRDVRRRSITSSDEDSVLPRRLNSSRHSRRPSKIRRKRTVNASRSPSREMHNPFTSNSSEKDKLCPVRS